ncbi:hypothetical protein [Listeria ivanovii]|uniref:hypothetical protein n=1 Tax=Listeria ivanovii TaxID=1638 RepID=UPI00130EA774|nr:hypothetical protein [Listeria ivanovii]MBK1965268.1 hypothetical protein [Listeria ivanovii subsp. londoniensis]MBK1984722.1 hypothetical protein [Listeria ivanovii subsp. londoniensis]MBK1994435.1 hypothetical protein [Listeria ivanovii subsp. londoniensis]
MNMVTIDEYWDKHDDTERLSTLKLYRQLNIKIEDYMIDWLISQVDLTCSKSSSESE